MACGVGWKGMTNAGLDKVATDTLKKHSKKLMANFFSTTPLVARLLGGSHD